MKRKINVQRPNSLAVTVLLAALCGVGLIDSTWAASTLQFAASTYSVAESAGPVGLTVQRVGDPNEIVSVEYATADGTATKGSKYAASSGTLAFGVGETNKLITVPILNNGFAEGTKTFQIVLTNPTGGAILGARATTTVSITDNDVGIQFSFATYSAGEDSGAVMLGVVRGDDGDLPVTVDFSTTDLTATDGLD